MAGKVLLSRNSRKARQQRLCAAHPMAAWASVGLPSHDYGSAPQFVARLAKLPDMRIRCGNAEGAEARARPPGDCHRDIIEKHGAVIPFIGVGERIVELYKARAGWDIDSRS